MSGDIGQFFADLAQDVGRGLHLTDKSAAQVHAEEALQQATSHGEAERARLAAQNQALRQGIGGYDPPAVKGDENFAAYTHQEIYDRNRELEAGAANEAAKAWRDAGSALKALGAEHGPAIRQHIESGWEGEAAEAAAKSAEPVSAWLEKHGPSFEMTGNRIEEAGTSAEQVKNAVPEPEGVNIGRAVASGIATGPMGGCVDAFEAQRERQQGERQAQELMGRVMGGGYQQVSTQMPVYSDMQGKPVPPPPPPPPPSNDPLPPPVVPPQSMNSNMGIASTTPSSVTNSSSVPMPQLNQTPDGTNSQWAPSPGQQPPGHNPIGRGPGGVQPPGGGGVMPVPGPGGWNRNPGGSGGPGGTGRGGPGRGPGGGLGGGGAGGAGRVGGGVGAGAGAGAGARGLGAGGGAGAGGPGAGGRGGVGSVPGSGSGSGSGPGAGGMGAAGGSGASGRGAGGGMAGAGRGQGQGGEDEEHERPSWLEEHDDVWLNDMPKVAPPVFGE